VDEKADEPFKEDVIGLGQLVKLLPQQVRCPLRVLYDRYRNMCSKQESWRVVVGESRAEGRDPPWAISINLG